MTTMPSTWPPRPGHRPAPRSPLRLREAALAGFLAPLVVLASQSLAAAAESTSPQTAPAAEAALPRRVVLRVLTEGDYPPFNFYDEDGILTGFNVDLARALCLELSTVCDIKVRPWEELIPALGRGEADAVMAGHTVSALALQHASFTRPYFYTPGRFAMAKEAAAKAVITPEGFEGKRIACARGTPHEAYLRAFFRDSAVVQFDSVDLARDALSTGKVDAVFEDGISLAFWLNGANSKQCCEFAGGPFLEPKFFGEGMAIAVPQSDPEVRRILDKALAQLRTSGRLEELVQRYFPFRIY